MTSGSSDYTRREFLERGSVLAAAAVLPFPGMRPASVPPFLQGYRALWDRDPRSATLKWFQDSRFGLFMHFGLYSLLGRHEWVMHRENIPVSTYEKLRERFTAEKFDADAITDMALDAGMRYVCITTRHHDGFCLFESRLSHYNVTRCPARRDLIAELADQCKKKRLGLFFYYSYALDWWHPYFYPRKFIAIARPKYDPPEPRYLWRRDEDSAVYVAYVHGQLKELLSNYGQIAGIWFDPIMGMYARPDLFPIDETYALVRRLQPHALISFKQGANGKEDFAAPERSGHSLEGRVRKRLGEEAARVARDAWRSNEKKPIEVCDTLQPHGWGYMKKDDGKHKTAADVMKMLEGARQKSWNLLLNTGPLGDGSIHVEDRATLAQVEAAQEAITVIDAILATLEGMHPALQALLATLFTWGVTALGASLVFFFKTVNQKVLDAMMGFAAGVMIAASFWSLLAPAIEMSGEVTSLPRWAPALIGFLLGGAFLASIDKILPHLHVGFPTEQAEGISTGGRRSVLLVLAITLHNIPEGLAVGVAFGAVAYGLPSATLGAAIALAIGIGLQNFPEGTAVSVPLRREGMGRGKAFLYGQASGLVEPIAGVLGALAVLSMRSMLPYALAFAAGAMIFVVIEELIPESQLAENTDLATMATLVGFSVMMTLDVALG